ncbi:MAG: translation initiation factor IF-2 N-terminal domain-containing protein, partial [Myxococcota bacterium]|nr:translation initiation factor IF-2 N-terminal domain-containing protein [Myxococcota bacterium]
MSKKRVHEIAKELKGHGIELDNKEVVTELVSLGYDVKSHSSSLEDDQATAAVQKILDKRKPQKVVPQVAPKGFVVRRKVADTQSYQEQALPPPPPPVAAAATQAPPPAEIEEVQAAAELQAPTAHVEPPPAAPTAPAVVAEAPAAPA